MNAHEFEFTSVDGERLALADFAGKTILLVNTASECGFTPQYSGLQTLWENYRDQGLVIIGIPSNDFGEQEPGNDSEIKAFCTKNYAVDFPLTSKQKVIGAEAHPLYLAVKDELGGAAVPKWNFHKYLFDPAGELVEIWPPKVEPLSDEITAVIKQNLPGN
jgi:glutathione peroxidase